MLMQNSFPSLRLLLLFAAGSSVVPLALGADPLDTVSVVLLDGDMREDWPDPGVVGFHRLNTVGPLMITYSLGGTATPVTDYTGPAGTTLTIPDGEREAWLEFAPTGQLLNTS